MTEPLAWAICWMIGSGGSSFETARALDAPASGVELGSALLLAGCGWSGAGEGGKGIEEARSARRRFEGGGGGAPGGGG